MESGADWPYRPRAQLRTVDAMSVTSTTIVEPRDLGRSGITVGALGLGCWAIGGPWSFAGSPAGWSMVDDDESVRAIRTAIDLGVTLFDTAANYGAGHSERLLGRAIEGRRDDVVIATKFGYAVDEAARTVAFHGDDEATSDVARHVRDELHATLRRLGTDHVDVYLLHVGSLEIDRALEVRAVLEGLVDEGSIRTYGWSTDRLDAVEAFATAPHCHVVEQQLSVLDDAGGPLLAACERLGLASLVRGPLGMGLLTGKFAPTTTFPADDVRSVTTWHPGFRDGRPTPEWLDRLERVRDVLTASGHTLAQGALAWLWARSPNTVPIPGFKSVAQVEENCGALAKGALSADQVAEIDRLLGRTAA